MPSFDVVSEVDRQELRNAIDQAQRELATRFDFKNTDSSIEQAELVLTLRTSSEDRLRALKTLLEERLVKRNVSLKGLDWGKIEQASGESVRQIVTVKVGISSDKAREVNKMIKEKGPKGTSSQTQGEQIRVTSKKRDDLTNRHHHAQGCGFGNTASVQQLPRLSQSFSSLQSSFQPLVSVIHLLRTHRRASSCHQDCGPPPHHAAIVA